MNIFALDVVKLAKRGHQIKKKKNNSKTMKKTIKTKKESGCVDPLHGIKSRCVVHIVPQNKSCVGFKMDPDIISKAKHVND